MRLPAFRAERFHRDHNRAQHLALVAAHASLGRLAGQRQAQL